MCLNELRIEHSSCYIYLGSPFTSVGSVSSAVKLHAKNNSCHVKYVSFVKKNNDIPFIVKKRVFDAALMSSLLYGCESWVGADIRPIMKLYNWSLKQLLGVRKATANLICYAEAGYPTLQDMIKFKQHKFYHKMWQERSEMTDDPLSFAIRLVCNCNTNTGKMVKSMIREDIGDFSELLGNVHNTITTSYTSRFEIYKCINPSFSVHEIYKSRHAINETHRMSFTRFRVSGHSLAVETGRWNRRGRGRLPVEERLCVCGLVQTERHVIETCPFTQDLRQNYNISTLESIFTESLPSEVACKIVHEILAVYG